MDEGRYKAADTGIVFLRVKVPKKGCWIGTDDTNDTDASERPRHQVLLTEFWLAKTEVTNRQYQQYFKDSEYHDRQSPKPERPKHWDKDGYSDPDQPVVGVSWDAAEAFCTWLQHKIEADRAEMAKWKVVLPTEAQWEFAARGEEERLYPWGDKETPTKDHAHFSATKPIKVGILHKGIGPFGHYDLAGNVQEWCRDVWDQDAYSNRLPLVKDPCVTGDGNSRSLRGGGYKNNALKMRTTVRNHQTPHVQPKYVGFRVAMESAEHDKNGASG
ncbi:MAG: formylglycine-generating enzyme family protein [Myxococcota bacterium]